MSPSVFSRFFGENKSDWIVSLSTISLYIIIKRMKVLSCISNPFGYKRTSEDHGKGGRLDLEDLFVWRGKGWYCALYKTDVIDNGIRNQYLL